MTNKFKGCRQDVFDTLAKHSKSYAAFLFGVLALIIKEGREFVDHHDLGLAVMLMSTSIAPLLILDFVLKTDGKNSFLLGKTIPRVVVFLSLTPSVLGISFIIGSVSKISAFIFMGAVLFSVFCVTRYAEIDDRKD